MRYIVSEVACLAYSSRKRSVFVSKMIHFIVARNTSAKSGGKLAEQSRSFIFCSVSNKTMRLLDVISFECAPIRPMVIVWTQPTALLCWFSINKINVHIQVAQFKTIPWYYSCFDCEAEQFICTHVRRGQLWNALALAQTRDESK